MNRKKVFLEGMRDGLPIGLGYFAVAFSLGIIGKQAKLTALQGFIASLFTAASAGEYAVFTLIAAQASYMEVIIMTLVANARYMLMSAALSQKMAPDLPMRHRLGVGMYVTDELFGIAIARPGHLDPWYSYGAFAVAPFLWALGTAIGIIAGNVLSVRIVSALSVALYGMFLAVFIPPARESKVIAGLVAISFAASYAASHMAVFAGLSSGTRTILLTVVIAAAAAVLFPHAEEEEGAQGSVNEQEPDKKAGQEVPHA